MFIYLLVFFFICYPSIIHHSSFIFLHPFFIFYHPPTQPLQPTSILSNVSPLSPSSQQTHPSLPPIDTFIHPPIIHSFVHSSPHQPSYTSSLTYSSHLLFSLPNHSSLLPLFSHSLILSFFPPTHPPPPPPPLLIHPPTQSSTHPPTHPPTHPLIHPPTHLLILLPPFSCTSDVPSVGGHLLLSSSLLPPTTPIPPSTTHPHHQTHFTTLLPHPTYSTTHPPHQIHSTTPLPHPVSTKPLHQLLYSTTPLLPQTPSL